ncbi:transmembrane protein 223 [Protopterus annectens]|uniref:transmembrane protein 223 n=1 Tax=Protopterus annectens TaxID=7888 RepID=UPI001CFC25A6|nr:transmembrane protein 223 [Protopterus annectens]
MRNCLYTCPLAPRLWWCLRYRPIPGKWCVQEGVQTVVRSHLGKSTSGRLNVDQLLTRTSARVRGLFSVYTIGNWVKELQTGFSPHYIVTRFIVSSAVPHDVLLFKHQRGTFFRVLGFFIVGQFVFWTYLAHFAFTSLRKTGIKDTVIVDNQGKKLPKLWGVSLNLGSDKWRYGFTLGCLTVGSVILAAGFVFARRSVHKVLLHRGGQQVTFTTYYPFGMTSSFTTPLRDVSCVSHRSEVPSVIPVKVKGHPFYFLFDKEGQFFNAKLFDITVGAYRKL